MENAADALKMAGSILMFVIALSVAITAFSQARATSDIILSYSDRETSYISGDSNYYYIASDQNRQRTVGVETIVPALYRTSVENYKIVFNFRDGYWIYKYQDGDNNWVEEKTIDPKVFYDKVSILNNKDTEEFFNGILYGPKNKNAFEKKFKIELNVISLYTRIEDKTFKESLGMYYQEDENNDSKSSDKNKTIKRVITYEEEK